MIVYSIRIIYDWEVAQTHVRHTSYVSLRSYNCDSLWLHSFSNTNTVQWITMKRSTLHHVWSRAYTRCVISLLNEYKYHKETLNNVLELFTVMLKYVQFNVLGVLSTKVYRALLNNPVNLPMTTQIIIITHINKTLK